MSYMDLKFSGDSVFLVTGGAGFIGSNLCEAILKLGCKVVCLDNLSNGKIKNVEIFNDNPNFTFLHGDVRDYNTCLKACEGVTYVLHQAAWGSVPRSIEMPLLYEDINIRGTLNMMEASRVSNVKKFVYASSSSVYGDHPLLPKKEGTEGNLLSPYALTKRTNEEYGKLYHQLYNLDTYGLRYFNVFGKRQDPESAYAAVIPKFILQLLKKETPIIYGDGNQSRDFTYIENVIEANLKACAAGKNAAGKVYNIAYGSREYLVDVFEQICKELEITVTPIFSNERVGDIRHSNADICLAKELLEYNPKYSFKDGLKLAIDWYVDYFNHIVKEPKFSDNSND